MKAGSFNKAAQESKANREYSLLPEGNYTVKLTNVTTDETKDPARISFEFTTVNKRKVFKNLTMKESEGNIKYINWQLELLGIDSAVAEASEADPEAPLNRVIYEAGAEMLDTVYDITIRHSEYQNKKRAEVDLSANGPLPKGSKLKDPVGSKVEASSQQSSFDSGPAPLDTNEEIPF